MVSPPADASDELIEWLCATLARACHLERRAVTAESRVLDLGLDSLTLVSVLTQLEAVHGFELSPDDTLALLDAPDVRTLAGTLAHMIDRRGQDGRT